MICVSVLFRQFSKKPDHRKCIILRPDFQDAIHYRPLSKGYPYPFILSPLKWFAIAVRLILYPSAFILSTCAVFVGGSGSLRWPGIRDRLFLRCGGRSCRRRRGVGRRHARRLERAEALPPRLRGSRSAASHRSRRSAGRPFLHNEGKTRLPITLFNPAATASSQTVK